MLNQLRLLAFLLALTALAAACGGGGGGGGGESSTTTMKAKIELNLGAVRSPAPYLDLDPYAGATARLYLGSAPIEMVYLGDGEFSVDTKAFTALSAGLVEIDVGNMVIRKFFYGVPTADGILDIGPCDHASTFVADLIGRLEGVETGNLAAVVIRLNNRTTESGIDVPALSDLVADGGVEAYDNGVAAYLEVYNQQNIPSDSPTIYQLIADNATPALNSAQSAVNTQNAPLPTAVYVAGSYRVVESGVALDNQSPDLIKVNGSNVLITLRNDGTCSYSLEQQHFAMVEFPPFVQAESRPQAGACRYRLNSLSELTLLINEGSGTYGRVGPFFVSDDSNTLVAANPGNSFDGVNATNMIVGVKVQSGTGNASLSGTYKVFISDKGMFRWTQDGGGAFPKLGNTVVDMTFNGAGGCSGGSNDVAAERSDNGVVSWLNNDTFDTCTYTLSSGGKLTLTVGTGGETGTVVGYPSAGGQLFVSGGPRSDTYSGGSDYDSELVVGVKMGSAMTDATLAGKYKLVNSSFGMDSNDQGVVRNHVENWRGEFNADGAGNCTISISGDYYTEQLGDNQNIFVHHDELSENSSCTYDVGANGIVNLDLGNQVVQLYLSADGKNIAMSSNPIVVEGQSTDYRTELLVGVRIEPGQ